MAATALPTGHADGKRAGAVRDSPHLLRTETFLRALRGLGSERSAAKASLSSSWRMARLASCSISLKVSLMLRNMEKKCSPVRVLTRTLSGNNRAAFLSSWVTSVHWTTTVTARHPPQRHLGHAHSFYYSEEKVPRC